MLNQYLHKKQAEKRNQDMTQFKRGAGSWRWDINDPKLLYQIFTCKNGESIESVNFKLCGATWQMVAFPNGWNSRSDGSFILRVYLVDMPNEWQQVTAVRTLKCINTSGQDTNIKTFAIGDHNGWGRGALTLFELNDSTSLSFEVDIKLLDVVTPLTDIPLCCFKLSHERYKHTQQYDYHINKELMNKMKLCKNYMTGKSFESDIWDDMWRITLYPYGNHKRDRKGVTMAFLQLIALPHGVASMDVHYTILCKETGASASSIHDFNYSHPSWSWSPKTLSFASFERQETVTFEVTVTVLQLYFLDGSSDIVNAYEDPVPAIEENDFDKAMEARFLSYDRKIEQLQIIFNESLQMLSQRTEKLEQRLFESESFDEKKQNENNESKQMVKTLVSDVAILKDRIDHICGSSNNKIKSKQQEVRDWLRMKVELEEYFDLFVENGLDDIQIIAQIKMSDLVSVGITKLGHRIKLLNCISMLGIQEGQPNETASII